MGENAGLEVLVVSFTDLGRDPRVSRQIRALTGTFRVVAAGHGDPGLTGVDFVPLAPRRKSLAGRMLGAARLVTRRFERYYWSTRAVTEALSRLSGRRPGLLVANDLETLPLALRIAGEAPVVFDAHEYAPREFEDLLFRLLHRPYRVHLCRAYVPRVRAMMTVCDRIAEEYERLTAVRPDVVWNAPDFQVLEPGATGDRIRLVHHGGAQRSRGIESMIRMMGHLDARFELNLVLVGHDRAYMDSLRRLAAGDPRIRFLDPVPMLELPRFLNRFDVGVYILQPSSFNNLYALPNKFFEFVQARLAVAIGPSPEMARLVRRHDLGLVANDFAPQTLARALSQWTPEHVARHKQNAHRAARELSAEAGRERILALARQALDGNF